MSELTPKKHPNRRQAHNPTPRIEHMMLKVEIRKWCDSGNGHWYPTKAELVFREGSWHRRIAGGEWANTGHGINELSQVMGLLDRASNRSSLQGQATPSGSEMITPDKQEGTWCILTDSNGLESYYIEGEGVCHNGSYLKCKADGSWDDQGRCPDDRKPTSVPPGSTGAGQSSGWQCR